MTKTTKLIIWCGMIAVVSFWMWAGVQSWFAGSLFEIQNIHGMVILGCLFIILLALLAVGLVVFEKRLWSLILSLIVAGTFFIIFHFSWLNIIGVAILTGLFVNAE